MSKEFTCKEISRGKMEGEITLSSDAVCFYTVEPETGKVIESNHHLKDKNIAGKVLVMSLGKESFVVQADGFYKLQLHRKAPEAIITQHADIVLVSGAVIMKIPTVHKIERGFYQEIKDGTKICMDADNRKITIF